MRTTRFRHGGGFDRAGEWTEDGIVSMGETFDPDDPAVEVLPPSEPTKIIGVSTNTRELVFESGRDLEAPDRPKLFTKTANTLLGHDGSLTTLPGNDLDWEGELGIVIGTQCRHVDVADAMDVVAGFTCVNDVTNHSQRDTYGVRFKSVDGCCPAGPCVAAPDLVPEDAAIELRVNGETRATHSRDSLLFSVEEIVAEISTYMTLEPGDLIPTGAAPEIGTHRPGDRVEIEVEGVGVLEHDVRAPGGD